MTEQRRREAIIDLKDFAMELEQDRAMPIGTPYGELERLRGQRWDRARLLRDVAQELARMNDLHLGAA
jgi:hypothetical protein